MADDGLTLDIDTSEIQELIKQFPEYKGIVMVAVREAMIGSLDKFDELIKAGTPVGVSGDLRKSFQKTRRVRKNEGVATGEVSTSLAYGLPIERGRTPGKKMPPVDAIELWIRRTWDNVPSAKKIRGVAFVVARAIGEKGFRKVDGYRMVEKAFEDGSPDAIKLFDLATQKSVVLIEKKIEAID